MGITIKELDGLAKGAWLSESLGKGNGTFTARQTTEGIIFYFRYTQPDKSRDTYRFASYDKNRANGGVTLKDAREKAGELSKEYKNHPNLREYIESQQHQESDRINQERIERKNATLEALLNGYSEFLISKDKIRSAQDTKSLFRRRVFATHPELASMKASSVTTKNLNSIVAAVVAAGAGREAAKFRSYLSAAFAAALRSESDPDIPPCLHGFNLTENPAASLATLSKYNVARETTLSVDELRIYWLKIQSVPGVTGAALRLSLLLGGQRIFQLLRLQKNDVDLADNQFVLFDTNGNGTTYNSRGQIMLFDSKGKRSTPRRHILPLTEDARAELMPYLSNNDPYLLSSTKGRVPLDPGTVTNEAVKIAKQMVEEGTRQEPFQLRDIRRTVETLLASRGVSMDVRAQLQSHGLSGIQVRHYDKHLYMGEKLMAMQVLFRLLTNGENAQIESAKEEHGKIRPIRVAA